MIFAAKYANKYGYSVWQSRANEYDNPTSKSWLCRGSLCLVSALVAVEPDS